MSKRTRKQVRNVILKILADGKEHSFGELERKANTNWKTVRDHCEDFKFFNIAKISNKGVKISEEGRKLLSRL